MGVAQYFVDKENSKYPDCETKIKQVNLRLHWTFYKIKIRKIYENTNITNTHSNIYNLLFNGTEQAINWSYEVNSKSNESHSSKRWGSVWS